MKLLSKRLYVLTIPFPQNDPLPGIESQSPDAIEIVRRRRI